MQHKIGVYLRVSTEEQALRTDGSIENQKHRLLGFVDIKNMQEANWGKVIEIYKDEGLSAKDTKRPAFQRMMRDVRSGRINLILVTDLSRLSRNILDFCLILEDLRKASAKFLSIKEQFDTSTPAGEMMVFNMINLAQFERKQTSERVAMNFHARALRGLRNGSQVVLGYDRDPNHSGMLVVNDPEARDVRTIFETYLEEYSISRSVVRLVAIGVRPKATRRESCHHVNRGRWTTSTLSAVLRNPTYIGQREVNAKNKDKDPASLRPFERYQVVKASWPAIIDEATFRAVQKILDENQSRERLRLAKSEDRVFLCSGMIYCGTCGRPMVGGSGHGKFNVHRYYVHRPIPGEKVTCPVKTLPAKLVEEHAVRLLDEVFKREDYRKGLESRIHSLLGARAEQVVALKEEREQRLLNIQREIDATIRIQAQMDGAALDDLLKDKLLRLKDEKAETESQLAEIESQAGGQMESASARRVVEDNIAEFLARRKGVNRKTLKRLMTRVYDGIVIYPDRLRFSFRMTQANADAGLAERNKRASELASEAQNLFFLDSYREAKRRGDVTSLPAAHRPWDKEVGTFDIVRNGRGGGI